MPVPIKKSGNAYLLSLSSKLYPAEAIDKTLKDYPRHFIKASAAKKADHLVYKVASSSLNDALEIGNYLLSLTR